MLSDCCPVCPVCNVGVLWPNGWMDQDETCLGPSQIVLHRDPTPPKRGTAPKFLAHVCHGQVAGWIKVPLGMEVGLGPGDIVLDGDWESSSPKMGAQQPPIFGPFTAVKWLDEWMPLGMEVGLGPGHIALDGDPATPPSHRKGGIAPIFSPCLLWPNGWMNQDATWYRGRPQPRRHCVRWGSSSPTKGAQQPPPPLFGRCLLWPNGHPSQCLQCFDAVGSAAERASGR